MSDSIEDTPAAENGENEVMRAARESRERKDAAEAAEAELKNDGNKRSLGWKAAAGLGVGSAAVLAALLYANRGKR